MKKTLKKLSRQGLASFLALVLCMGTMSLPAMAAELDDSDKEDSSDMNIEVVYISDNSRDADPAEGSAESQDAENTNDLSKEADVESDDKASVEEPEETPEFPVDGSEEDQQKWFQDNVNRPQQTPDVETNPGTDKDNPDAGKTDSMEPTDPTEGQEPSDPADGQEPTDPAEGQEPTDPADGQEPTEPAEGQEPSDPADGQEPADPAGNETPDVPEESAGLPGLTKDPNWEVFYDKATDTYKLTYTIADNAEGDQTLDLTYAMELLHQYAQNARDNSSTVYDQKTLLGLFTTVPTVDDYPEELMAIVKEYGKDGEWLDDQLYWCWKYNQPLDTKFQALLDAHNASAKQLDGTEADVLQPGDIRKFEIFLSSQSGHTYKYKDGSFTLATPDWSGRDDLSNFTGFDGQLLPDEYVDHAEYNVTLRSEPIQSLLTNMGFDSFDVFNGPRGEDSTIIKYLKDNYGGETVAESMNNYLLQYYNDKDGTKYTTIAELVKNNPDAKVELTKTETSGNKWFTLNGEKFKVDAHLETVKYNEFYSSLFSFIYGSKEMVDSVTGGKKDEHQDGSWTYENDSWTDEGRELALKYYMSHQEIWGKTNAYFQELLETGLSKEQASWTSFMMALNIDGELTGNDWQITKWGWYNSIQLEQMDIDFSLDKVDQNGDLITSDEADFQIWYVGTVTTEDGEEVEANLYLQMDEKGTYVWVEDSSAIVSTKGGHLDIDYTLMKDIVYYLQEAKAPEGYDRDTTVYVITDPETYNQMVADGELELDADGNPVYKYFGDLEGSQHTTSDSGVTSVTVKFVNKEVTATPGGDPENPPPPPPPTPEDPDDPPPPPPGDEDGDNDDDPTPPPTTPTPETPETPDTPVEVEEEPTPLTDMPEEEVPLTNMPVEEEEELIDIPDDEVPLAEVPMTGDISGVWYVMALISVFGLAALSFFGKRKEMRN